MRESKSKGRGKGKRNFREVRERFEMVEEFTEVEEKAGFESGQ